MSGFGRLLFRLFKTVLARLYCKLLYSSEIDLRREAWERRRYGSSLYGGSSLLQSVVDPDALRELVNSESKFSQIYHGAFPHH